MKKIFLLLLGCLMFTSCATPQQGTVSTIPWEERSQIDGLSREYGAGEETVIYDGMVTPEMAL